MWWGMTEQRPRLYFTNAASVLAVRRGVASPKVAASVGQGHVWTIMARPRAAYCEQGDGTVVDLVPREEDLDAIQRGEIALDEYRTRYYDSLLGRCFKPGHLLADDGRASYVVEAGATLICACSRAKAAAGRCHRVWAANICSVYGWQAVLDGEDLDGATAYQVWLVDRAAASEQRRARQESAR